MPRNDGSSYSIVECNARNFYEGFIPQSFIYNTLKQFLPSLNEYRNDFPLFECREYILQQVFVEWNLDESNFLQLRKRLLFGEYKRFYFSIKNRIIERYASLPSSMTRTGFFPYQCRVVSDGLSFIAVFVPIIIAGTTALFLCTSIFENSFDIGVG